MQARTPRSSRPAVGTFSALTLDRRLLITPSRVITLASVATMNVGPQPTSKPRLTYAALALVFAFLGAATWLANTGSPTLVPQLVAGLLGLIGVGFLVLLLKPEDQTTYFSISTSDGVVSRFSCDDEGLLDEALRLVSDAINQPDTVPRLHIDFARATLSPLSDEPAAPRGPVSQPSGAAQHRDSATVPRHAGPVHGNGPANPAARSQGRNPIQTSPPGGSHAQMSAPQGAAQPMAQANGYGTAPHFADFTPFLPSVVEMQRFYARQPNSAPLEQRLSELELLMRSGGQTTNQKHRIQDLSQELAEILSPYPQAAELFNDIAAAVGD